MGFVGKVHLGDIDYPIGAALYGTCSTAATSASKSVVMPDFDELITGLTIKIKFSAGNTANNPTLTINGIGPKPIYRHGIVPPGTAAFNTWAAGAVISFTYDGGAWLMEEPFDFSTIFSAIYPVGSIYVSVNSTSPATLFGGTWEQITDKFLLCAGSTYAAGSTGGSATHTLTAEEMPSHTHSVGAHAHGLNSHKHSIPALSGTAASAGSHKHQIGADNYRAVTTSGSIGAMSVDNSLTNRVAPYTANGVDPFYKLAENSQSAGAHTHSVTTVANTSGAASGNTANSSAFDSGSAGSGNSHSIMPPYLAVYVWKRTA